MFELIREFTFKLIDMGLLSQKFSYAFIINAVISAIIIGPLLGIMGTMVVTKKYAFFSEAIGHAALTGISIGILLGESYTSPYISLFTFCILFGVAINYVKNRTNMSADLLIGVFLTISIAIGAGLLSLVNGVVNNHILESVLFGSILTVTDLDNTVLLTSLAIVLIILYYNYNNMLLSSFNESLAIVRGVKTRYLEYLFIIILTIVTVISVKIVGAILVEALLLIPAASARNLTRNIKSFTLVSILISTVSCILGIVIPLVYSLPLPTGSTIILIAGSIFVLTTIYKSINRRGNSV